MTMTWLSFYTKLYNASVISLLNKMRRIEEINQQYQTKTYFFE